MLGKKSANCLSCSKGQDGFEARAGLIGKDGRMYVGEGKTAKKKRGGAEGSGSPGNGERRKWRQERRRGPAEARLTFT